MEQDLNRINRYVFEFIEGGEVDAKYGFPFNPSIAVLGLCSARVPQLFIKHLWL
jgi:hypothetical protein